MRSAERACWLRSAIAGYAGCNGTRPIAKVLQEPRSAPRGESQAAAWQNSREYLLPIRYQHQAIAKPSLLLGELAQLENDVDVKLTYDARIETRLPEGQDPPISVPHARTHALACLSARDTSGQEDRKSGQERTSPTPTLVVGSSLHRESQSSTTSTTTQKILADRASEEHGGVALNKEEARADAADGPHGGKADEVSSGGFREPCLSTHGSTLSVDEPNPLRRPALFVGCPVFWADFPHLDGASSPNPHEDHGNVYPRLLIVSTTTGALFPPESRWGIVSPSMVSGSVPLLEQELRKHLLTREGPELSLNAFSYSPLNFTTGNCGVHHHGYYQRVRPSRWGITNLQRTIDSVLETTMGIESKIAMAGCIVSTTVCFARAAVTKTLKIITVQVQKQQLITELSRTNKTRSSLIALSIMCGLMGLYSEEIEAMPPPKGDTGKARSRRGSAAETDESDVSALFADFTPEGDDPVQPQIEAISPLPGTLESERMKNEELEERLKSLESKMTQEPRPPSTEGSADLASEIQRQVQMALNAQASTLRDEADEQRRKQERQLEEKMRSMEAHKAAEIEQALQNAEEKFNLLVEDQATRAEELETEIRRLQDQPTNSHEARPRDKFDELKTLMVRTEPKYCFNSEKGYNAYVFYTALKRQLSLISQYKGGMVLKRYMEIIARVADDDIDQGMPEQAQSDPQLKALYAAKMKYAEGKSHASMPSPTKSTTVTSEAEPGTYTNKMMSKDIVVVPEDSAYHPSNWDHDTHHLDGKLFTMVEQYWFAGPMLKKMVRECTSVSYGQTYSYAVTIAIKDMLTRELTRKRLAGRMWTEPSLALTFTNPEEFLRKWSERMRESRDSGLTLVDIYGLNFLSAFAKIAQGDVAYNAAIEEFDQGFKDEKELNLWIEKTVNQWQKFQAMNPTRKPKQDKDALATIKDLQARVTTQEAAINKLSKGKGKGKGKGDKHPKGGRGDGDTRKCTRCGQPGGHKRNGDATFDGKYCFRKNHAETKEEITTPKTPEAIALEKEIKEKKPPNSHATKHANAVETFKQMGKTGVEGALSRTTTHLDQIEQKVSKLLSEGTTPKDALATVKKQEEALRVKKAQLNEALSALVTHVTHFTLYPDGNMEPRQDDGLGFVEQEHEGQNFKLTDDDDSAHQSGSPIAHKGSGDNPSAVSASSATGPGGPHQDNGLGFVGEDDTPVVATISPGLATAIHYGGRVLLRYNAATKIQAHVRGRLLSQQRRVNMMVASGLGKAELLQREADEFQSKAELLQREAAKFQKEAADRLRAMMKSHEEKRAERKRKAEQPALDPPPYESPNHGYFPRCRGFRNNPPTCLVRLPIS